MSGVVPSEEFNRQLVATVRQVLRSVGQEFGSQTNTRSLTDQPTVKLADDLAAATDGLDDATLPSATANFLKPKTGGGWEIDSARTITLFNRVPTAYSAGAIGRWRMSLGKACFIADGGGGGGDGADGSGSCSIYVQDANLLHTSTGVDIPTLRKWDFRKWCCARRTMGLIQVPVDGGTASWTGGSGTVEYDDALDAWVYEIPGDEITVIDSAGDEVAYIPKAGFQQANRSGQLVVTLTAASGWSPTVTLEATIP